MDNDLSDKVGQNYRKKWFENIEATANGTYYRRLERSEGFQFFKSKETFENAQPNIKYFENRRQTKYKISFN